MSDLWIAIQAHAITCFFAIIFAIIVFPLFTIVTVFESAFDWYVEHLEIAKQKLRENRNLRHDR